MFRCGMAQVLKYKAFRQSPGEHCLANVMWIKWKNGVAERPAIGQVHEDAWVGAPNGREVDRAGVDTSSAPNTTRPILLLLLD